MQKQDQTINEKFTIPDDYHGLRVDQAVAKLLSGYSRSQLQKWLASGQILINGQRAAAKQKVQGGESVVLNVLLQPDQRWEAQALPLNIVYQNDDIVIVNKPADLVTHPGAGNPDGTLVNALLHHIPETQNLPRAGIIHRLDKETSGLLVVAKTLHAHNDLVKALQAREIHREYECIVQGKLISGGTVDEPIGRHPKNRLQQAVITSGKPAITHYRIIQRFQHYTHLKVVLETGRTHQIRVHMAHIGHPIVGDPLYGGRKRIPKNLSPELKIILDNFNRQALHAKKLILINPSSGESQTFEIPAPEDFLILLNGLKEYEACS